MFSIFEKIIEKLQLNVGFLNRTKSPSSKVKQKNKTGDNVGRDQYNYYNSRSDQEKNYRPHITFGLKTIYRGVGPVIEIYNSGTEAVKNLKVSLGRYIYDEETGETKKEEHVVSRFIDVNEDPIRAYPSSLNILDVDERKIALEVPPVAVKKKISVRVECIGVKSNIPFNEKYTFETARDYPNRK